MQQSTSSSPLPDEVRNRTEHIQSEAECVSSGRGEGAGVRAVSPAQAGFAIPDRGFNTCLCGLRTSRPGVQSHMLEQS